MALARDIVDKYYASKEANETIGSDEVVSFSIRSENLRRLKNDTRKELDELSNKLLDDLSAITKQLKFYSEEINKISINNPLFDIYDARSKEAKKKFDSIEEELNYINDFLEKEFSIPKQNTKQEDEELEDQTPILRANALELDAADIKPFRDETYFAEPSDKKELMVNQFTSLGDLSGFSLRGSVKNVNRRYLLNNGNVTDKLDVQVELPNGDYISVAEFKIALNNYIQQNKGRTLKVEKSSETYALNPDKLNQVYGLLKACSKINISEQHFATAEAEDNKVTLGNVSSDIEPGLYASRKELVGVINSLFEEDGGTAYVKRRHD